MFSDAYASSIQSQIHQSCDKAINQENILRVECGGNDVCKKCIAIFYPNVMTDSPEKIQQAMPIIDQIRDGACSTLCTCSATGVNFKNFLNVNASCVLNPDDLDLDKIAENIAKVLAEQTQQVIDQSTVTDIVNKTVVQISQDIHQAVQQLQVVELKGYGTMSGISLENVSNITMKAVASLDEANDFINSLVQDLMDEIKASVNKNVEQSFRDAFQDNVTYFIITGSIMAAAFFMLLVLLVIKAAM